MKQKNSKQSLSLKSFLLFFTYIMFAYYEKQYSLILILYMTKNNEKFKSYDLIKNYTSLYKNNHFVYLNLIRIL